MIRRVVKELASPYGTSDATGFWPVRAKAAGPGLRRLCGAALHPTAPTQAGLREHAGDPVGEVVELLRQPTVPVEVEVPALAREAGVPDVDDLPSRRRLDIDDEIHASVLCETDVPATEDHLATSTSGTDLAGSEAEWHQDRIQGVCDHLELGVAIARRMRSPRHNSMVTRTVAAWPTL